STIDGPAVVKPRAGNRSRGVSTHLESEGDIREAFLLARTQAREVILQEHIEPEDEMRVMASTSEAISVVKRVLPNVVGDGVSTIRQLIQDKNQQRILNPSTRSRPIPIDALTIRRLGSQGLALDDVVEFGRTVTVRSIGGLSAGADAFQVLEMTDSSVKNAAIAALRAIPGLEW